jgi:hypothetical protein
MSLPKVKIQVRVKDGVVKEVQGIPSHYSVRVLDYDAEKYERTELSEDENHKACRIVEWPSDGQQ